MPRGPTAHCMSKLSRSLPLTRSCRKNTTPTTRMLPQSSWSVCKQPCGLLQGLLLCLKLYALHCLANCQKAPRSAESGAPFFRKWADSWRHLKRKTKRPEGSGLFPIYAFCFAAMSASASLRERLILPWLSISVTLTRISSPTLTTSSTFSTR